METWMHRLECTARAATASSATNRAFEGQFLGGPLHPAVSKAVIGKDAWQTICSDDWAVRHHEPCRNSHPRC